MLRPLFQHTVVLFAIVVTQLGTTFSDVGSTIAAEDDWTEVKVPDDWRGGIADGWSTYRTRIRIPAEWSERRLDLFIEGADDARQALINGQSIVTLGAFPPNFRSGLGATGRYEVPRQAIRFGDWNTIEVRIFRARGRNNLNQAAVALFTETEAIHLAGAWQKRQGESESDPTSVPDSIAFDQVEASADVLSVLQRLEGDRGPQTPETALAALHAAEGLQVQSVLTDPVIGQPLSMKWDDRGRLWVAEYLQYPNPAGLQPISRDTFLRTVYDRVPQAPPHHDRGRDRISIHEDRDLDGVLDHHTIFVEGLNLATSFAIGRQGVYVLNPPYLLFYPDANHDDVPDGDPQVLLQGFGIEDSHSLANSLRWGPDGWLYAAQGSTVSASITKPGSDELPVNSVGQLIWRYHPPTTRYEVFAEGGGNAFGVEIDNDGAIFSGHNGGDTRGFHYVQGGYLQKGFSKHGELSNPYAFGYFSWMTHHAVARFTHTFVIEQGGLFQAPFANRLYGVEPLQGRVVMSDISAEGSTYRTVDVGYALESSDTWFRPVDIQTGPDGGLYVADFYEQRIDHASHYQGRVDPGTGRIYRISPAGSASLEPVSMLNPSEMVAALEHPNRTVRQTALARMFDLSLDEASESDSFSDDDLAQLRRFALPDLGPRALDLYWGLEATGQATLSDRAAALQHVEPQVRRWAIRLAADNPESIDPALLNAIVERASVETDVQVRSQLAASAKRLPVAPRLAIVETLVHRDLDASDPHVPLLLWWAIEAACQEAPQAVVNLVSQPSFAESTLAQQTLLSRVMRRYAAVGRREELMVCAALLHRAPNDTAAAKLLEGFDAAMVGRSPSSIPEELAQELLRYRSDSLELKVLLGIDQAIEEARQLIADDATETAKRIRLIEGLAARRSEADLPTWLRLVQESESPEIRSAAIGAMTPLNDPQVASTVLSRWMALTIDERLVAQTSLASRLEWSSALLESVEAGAIDPTEIAADTVRRMSYHDSPALRQQLAHGWPDVRATAGVADEAGVVKYAERVLAGSGNPYDGRQLYSERCGKCHVLFGAGGALGPDLTSYQRTDLPRLLANVLTPSLEIREGFGTTVVETEDGLLLTGFIESQDETHMVLRQADGRAVNISIDSIVDRFESAESLMPTGLLDELNDQQLRDLFAYLRSAQPLP